MIETPRPYRKRVDRIARFSRIQPHAPREVRYHNGVLSWKPPADPAGITHFRIYSHHEDFLVREVPIEQTQLEEYLNTDRIFISSYNSPMRLESAHVMLDLTPGEPWGFPGGHVIGWDLQDCSIPGLDVADPVIPLWEGTVWACLIRIKTTDVSNNLEINIQKNGTSIFSTRPVIAAGTTTRDVQEFTGFAVDPLTVGVYDDLTIDIVQAGSWWVAVYLPYGGIES